MEGVGASSDWKTEEAREEKVNSCGGKSMKERKVCGQSQNDKKFLFKRPMRFNICI